MLSGLNIKNFTIIDEVELDFKNQMTVLTGETGAGKSIIIDALSLILGSRADSSLVRHGCQKADITAIFTINKTTMAFSWLKEYNLLEDDQSACIIRRTLSKDGRSQAYINGVPSTITQLKELGLLLVNIYGQHEHYALLKKANQLQRLDHYAKHLELKVKVANLFKAYETIKHELDNALKLQLENNAKLELLIYQVEELTSLDLKSGEIESLEKEHKLLTHAKDLVNITSNSVDALYDNFDANVFATINSVLTNLKKAEEVDKNLNNPANMLSEAAINIQEAANELREYNSNIVVDDERLSFIEKRLSSLYDMARKHSQGVETLPQYQQDLEKELKLIQASFANLDQLKEQLEKVKVSYLKAAATLSRSRAIAAKSLAKKVTSYMHELGMEGGEFYIDIESDETSYASSGIDKIKFLVKTNKGYPLDALNKIVSGGELSRIGLAISVLTAAQNPTPTLIFDEVDVGISGATSETVGKLLRALAQNCQIFCVTHLPQVAAQGHHHFHVKKRESNDIVTSGIVALNIDTRVKEIARMLSGAKLTEQSLAHAQGLLGIKT